MNILDKALIAMKVMFASFMTEEDGDVNVVSIVVLIGVAVALAVLFRGQIENLLKTLFGTVQNEATNAVTVS